MSIAKKEESNKKKDDENQIVCDCEKSDKTRYLNKCRQLSLKLTDAKLPKQSWAKISQIRTLSTLRIGKNLGKASDDEMEMILERLNEILGN